MVATGIIALNTEQYLKKTENGGLKNLNKIGTGTATKIKNLKNLDGFLFMFGNMKTLDTPPKRFKDLLFKELESSVNRMASQVTNNVSVLPENYYSYTQDEKFTYV